MLNKTLPILTTLALAGALTACGGGGGSSVTDTAAKPPLAPVITANLVTSVPAPSYTAATEELTAFNLLNAERSHCGFGVLAQNTALDSAARGHADWQHLNHIVGHIQSVGDIGFTGVMPADRITAAGYSTLGQFDSADEYYSITATDAKSGKGSDGVRFLLNAPYHLRSLVAGFREIGFSVRNAPDAGSATGSRVVVQADLANKTSDGKQLIGPNDVVSYPCEGTTGVNAALVNESPNPVPGRDLLVNPLGSSIYIAVREGQTLAITNASMIKVSTGSNVTLRNTITSANDPYAPCASGCYKSHEAYIAADAPLDTNAQYQVTVNGSNNGASFSRTFRFTTGLI
jgi:uncharacterized protein YkwD